MILGKERAQFGIIVNGMLYKRPGAAGIEKFKENNNIRMKLITWTIKKSFLIMDYYYYIIMEGTPIYSEASSQDVMDRNLFG